MKKSHSSEADSHSADQKISRFLWNPKFHYHVHKNLLLVPILSQMTPIHSCPPYFPKIYSNIILPSTPGSSKWSLLVPHMRATCPANLICLCIIRISLSVSVFKKRKGIKKARKVSGKFFRAWPSGSDFNWNLHLSG
jgi:hypothetical protein